MPALTIARVALALVAAVALAGWSSWGRATTRARASPVRAGRCPAALDGCPWVSGRRRPGLAPRPAADRILAYAGASLPVLLIFAVAGISVGDAVNREVVAGPMIVAALLASRTAPGAARYGP